MGCALAVTQTVIRPLRYESQFNFRAGGLVVVGTLERLLIYVLPSRYAAPCNSLGYGLGECGPAV
jgi:hypothetical protein